MMALHGPVALFIIVIERHVGAWQWKCAATTVPDPAYVPVIVCTHSFPSAPCGLAEPGTAAQPITPRAHLGTSYSIGEPMPQVWVRWTLVW